MKLQGGTLVYALAISLIIGMITASVLLNAHCNRMLLLLDVIREEAARNAHSGIQYLCARNDANTYEEDVDLFARQKDSVLVSSRPWGVYDILTANAHTGRETFQRIALAGALRDSAQRYALWLGDMDRELKVCGHTELRGKCFLPKAGVERAYIEGKSYSGRQLVYGPVETSTRFIPEYNRERYALMEQLLNEPFHEGDSLLNWSELQQEDSVPCTFAGPRCLVKENAAIEISNVVIEGQIIIQSSVSIKVTRSAVLHNVILVAPEITIDEKTTGQFQVIARDSILVGKEVTLTFPSSLCLCSEKTMLKHTGIIISEGCTISGDVLAIAADNDILRRTQITVNKDCRIAGAVYTNGALDLKGTVAGSVTCQKLVLTTNSATYENTLLDAVIDITQLPAAVPGGIGMGNSKRKEVIQWLD